MKERHYKRSDFIPINKQPKHMSNQSKTIFYAYKNMPDIYYGKKYEYIVKPVDNHFECYSREVEGEPWRLFSRFTIVDDIFFANYDELWYKKEQ